MQTKMVSLAEAIINTTIGFIVSMLFWPVAAHATGIQYNMQQHLVIVLLFTLISVARSYIIRRFFNSYLHRLAIIIAKNRSESD